MNCPSCKKDVEVSPGGPQVSRMRLEGHEACATVEVTDLCSECFDPLRHTKFDIERDLSGIEMLKGHIAHELNLETVKTERIEETPGYVAVLVHFDATCACGGLVEAYHGTLPGSSKWD